MIDRIFKTTKDIVNTEGRGNFSPSTFNRLLHNVVLTRFEEKFHELTRILNRQNRKLTSANLESIAAHIREQIEHYITPATPMTYGSGVFALPADLRYFDTILYDGIQVELYPNNTEFEYAKIMADVSYPIGLKQGTSVTIYPSTITSDVTVSYLRNPIEAKWTYQIVDEVELFDVSAGDYQDIDIHPSEETDVIMDLLLRFGINLKEQDLQAIVSREETQEFNQQNVS